MSSALIPWIGLLIIVELSVLLGYWHLFGRGVSPVSLFANVGAGGSLIAALWVSLVLHSQPLILLLLMVSCCCHIIDIKSRWKT